MGSKGNARAEPLDLSGNYAIRPGPSERNWGLELTQVVRNFPPGGPSNRVIRTHRREERVMDKREFMKVLGVGLGVAIVHPIKAAAQRGFVGLRAPGGTPPPSPADLDPGGGALPRRSRDHRARAGGGARPDRGQSREDARPAPGRRDPRRRQAKPDRHRGHPAAAAQRAAEPRGLLRGAGALVGGELILLGPGCDGRAGPPGEGGGEGRPAAGRCGGRGGGSGATSPFPGQDVVAGRGLREKVMEKADQRQVWAEVKKYAGRAGAAAPPDNYQAINDKPPGRGGP